MPVLYASPASPIKVVLEILDANKEIPINGQIIERPARK